MGMFGDIIEKALKMKKTTPPAETINDVIKKYTFKEGDFCAPPEPGNTTPAETKDPYQDIRKKWGIAGGNVGNKNNSNNSNVRDSIMNNSTSSILGTDARDQALNDQHLLNTQTPNRLFYDMYNTRIGNWGNQYSDQVNNVTTIGDGLLTTGLKSKSEVNNTSNTGNKFTQQTSIAPVLPFLDTTKITGNLKFKDLFNTKNIWGKK